MLIMRLKMLKHVQSSVGTIEEAFFNVVRDQTKYLKTGNVKKSFCGFIARTFYNEMRGTKKIRAIQTQKVINE